MEEDYFSILVERKTEGRERRREEERKNEKEKERETETLYVVTEYFEC